MHRTRRFLRLDAALNLPVTAGSCVRGVAVLFAGLLGHAAHAEVMAKAEYRGWETVRLANDYAEVQVAPAIGGRVIQLKLGPFEFLFVNPDLAGRTPGPTGLAADGTWLNFGGEKLWPAPQGKDGLPGHWNGPPDPVLDGSAHQASVLDGAVRLVSRDDPRSGIRFSREIRLYPGTTHVHVDATMTNIDTTVRRWGIWSARTRGSTFQDILPVFRQERVGAISFGLVIGKMNTQYPWGSPPNAPEPKVWFHDIFRPDGSPFDAAEVAFIKASIAKGPGA